jgi:hypothetical protein
MLFLSLGLVLEALHGLKWGSYIGVDVETRRTMWRLAHAHGGLIALIHLAFASVVNDLEPSVSRIASSCLIAAMALLPLGFFLGGVWFHAGDPGLGVLLVPVGGLSLLVSVALTLRGLSSGQQP